MIGEIRDEETAQIATRAAITGHLVLSTIHTNDAAGVIIRLINMGIPKCLVADALIGAISQRLVRKLCPKCMRKKKINLAQMQILNTDMNRYIYEAKGCPFCSNTGYVGRIGVFEILVLEKEIKELIMSNEFTSEKLNEILKNKNQSLIDNMQRLVLEGQTTFNEFEELLETI